MLSSCAPTFPARTLSGQLVKLVKDEEKLNSVCHITGKTLWVYVPVENLIDEKDLSWSEKSLDKMSHVLSIVHRAILSTDAKLDFSIVIFSDVKKYGIQLINYEYIPDIKEAIMERFSRGEFFKRSIKDIAVIPAAINDTTGESVEFYDMTFDRFLGLQVMHRTKSLFAKNKMLNKIFELKSSSQTQKFGTIKIEFEFVKKTYILTPEEEKLNPLDFVTQIAAEVAKNYNYKDLQAFELKDTFSGKTNTLDVAALKKIKIALPKTED